MRRNLFISAKMAVNLSFIKVNLDDGTDFQIKIESNEKFSDFFFYRDKYA